MISAFESFHIEGVPAGVIIRELSERTLMTTSCFRAPGGIVCNHSRIEFDQDLFGWTSFSYGEHGADRRVEVARDDSIAPGCVPSYAEWTLIRDMLQTDVTYLPFSVLTESDPTARPSAAELSITAQSGTIDQCGRIVPITGHIVMRVNGKVRNRHWFAGTRVVASDWNGARSYSVESLSAALVGLDGEVEAMIRGYSR